MYNKQTVIFPLVKWIIDQTIEWEECKELLMEALNDESEVDHIMDVTNRRSVNTEEDILYYLKHNKYEPEYESE